MNEYTIVCVIIALVGLIATVTTPIVKLNSTMSKLATMIDELGRDIIELKNKDKEIEEKNRQSHQDMYEKINKNTSDLVGHEGRIKNLEDK